MSQFGKKKKNCSTNPNSIALKKDTECNNCQDYKKHVDVNEKLKEERVDIYGDNYEDKQLLNLDVTNLTEISD